MYAVDPRRSESARWADVWLGIDVGSDIALANAVGREISAAGLVNEEFVRHSTAGFEAYKQAVDEWTLERAEQVTGVPADAIKQMAHDYATAETAQICWTLGITEHHTGTDNVLALISLALLTGHVGRYGSGLVPVRGQNNVQGGADVGALPNTLSGFQSVENDELRGKFEAAWGVELPAKPGKHMSAMIDAMEAGEITALYCLGENPAQSEADGARTIKILSELDFMVSQDMFLTKTSKMADVVFPAAAAWVETEGTVTSSERRVQRVRKALDPPGQAKSDMDIISLLADRMGHGWGMPTAEEAWDELRSLSPMHAGMSYKRLEDMGGIQWPCPDNDHPGTPYLHDWLREDPLPRDPAPFLPVEWTPPIDELNETFPIRMTTGRRLDGYNTGVQSGGYLSPLSLGGVIEISPEDGEGLGLAEGATARVSSRRGSIEAVVRIHTSLRHGLAFMPIHYPDEVDVNLLTPEAWDPKSGTAEFKATAVRIEPV